MVIMIDGNYFKSPRLANDRPMFMNFSQPDTSENGIQEQPNASVFHHSLKLPAEG